MMRSFTARAAFVLGCVFTAGAHASIVEAQSTTAAATEDSLAAMPAPSAGTRALCWRARALPTCRGWVITEVAVERPVWSSSLRHSFDDGPVLAEKDFETRLALTLGGMRNIGPSRGVGFTISSLGAEVAGRVEARYREWRGPDRGLDFSAGYTTGTFSGQAERPEVRAHGLTASAGVSETYLGADVRLDFLRAADGRSIRSGFVSVRAGSRAGPIIAAAGFVATMVFAFIVFSSEGT